MTENENSPENLRKFLESDDPALVQMGLSIAKGSGEIEKTIEVVTELILEEKFSLESINDIEDAFRLPIVRKIENKFNEEHDETWSRNDLLRHRLGFMEILSKYGDDKTVDSVIYNLQWVDEARDSIDETWEGEGAGELIVPFINCLWDIHDRWPSTKLREQIMEICKEKIGDSDFEVQDTAILILEELGMSEKEIEKWREFWKE